MKAPESDSAPPILTVQKRRRSIMLDDLRTDRKVVHRRAEHNDVGAEQFGNQGIRQSHCLNLLWGTLLCRSEESPHHLFSQVRNGIDCQIALDDGVVRVSSLPFAQELTWSPYSEHCCCEEWLP